MKLKLIVLIFAIIGLNACSVKSKHSDCKLESENVIFNFDPVPCTYQISEIGENGRMLLKSEGAEFGLNNENYTVISSTNVQSSDNQITAELLLNNTTERVSVSFEFSSSDILTVSYTGNAKKLERIAESYKDQGEKIYGLWEYPIVGDIDNRGTKEQLVGKVRYPDIHNHALAASAVAPFYMTSLGYGVYVETMELGEYEVAMEGSTRFGFDTPALKIHILYGPTYADILKKYNKLAGSSFMPPDWAFGLNVWRDADKQERVIQTIEDLRKHQIPTSMFMIDRPFGTGDHGWGNSDWDPKNYPEPEAMIKDLHDNGIELLLWIANRAANNFKDVSAKNNWLLEPFTESEADWPAMDARKPEVREWLKKELDFYAAQGIRGYKIDRGENGEMPREVQNEVAYYFNQLAKENLQNQHGDNHLVFARTVYDKGRKYAGIWNGDAGMGFNGLIVSIKNALRCGIMNFPYFGSDIGGYNRNIAIPNLDDRVTPKEVYARWLQMGTYHTFSSIFIGKDRTPWSDYDSELKAITKKQAIENHELIPYTRSCFYQSVKTGMPVIRALILEYPDDQKLADTWDSYHYGSELLIAPVTEEGARSRDVYLPEGQWLDYNDKSTVYNGGDSINVQAPLDVIPVYVREGAIIPRGNTLKANQKWIKNWNPTLDVEIFPGQSGERFFDYYDGEKTITISWEIQGNSLAIEFGDLGLPVNLKVYGTDFGDIVNNGETIPEIEKESGNNITVHCNGKASLKIASFKSLFE